MPSVYKLEGMLHLSTSLIEAWQTIAPLLLAVFCGGVVGMERRLRRKPTGLRTNMLVCLGTTVYVQLGTTLNVDHADPTRILGQIVVGIGFLGAGTIFTRQGFVVGLTTAATIWMNAAIGSAIGLGYYLYALVCTALCMTILYFVPVVAKREGGKHPSHKSSHHAARHAVPASADDEQDTTEDEY